MAIVEVHELKDQLAFTNDVGSADDALLHKKLEAAQDHIERLLGFVIQEEYPGAVPASLKEAVLQLAAHWFEHREGVTERLKEVPYGVSAIVAEYREYTW